MRRLFVALRPPPMLRQCLLGTMAGVSGARWQSDAQLHLTLAFLGDVAEDQAERLDAGLSRIDAPAVPLTLEGAGSFASRGRVHSLWIGAEPEEALERLAGKVRRAARVAGLVSDDQAFVPHITVARVNAGCGPVDGFIRQWSDLRAGPALVERFGLYESRLGSGGSAYHLLCEYQLRG